MEEYANVKKLIEWAEKFGQQLRDGEKWDDANFSAWLSNEIHQNPAKNNETSKKPQSSLLMAVYFLNKYAVFYSRRIFKNSLIYSLDDFSFLAALLPDKKLRKADVVRKNITEKSSGNEVLKRLLKHNLIKETNNPDDKRSKLLEITPLGFQEIFAVKEQMQKMATLVEGDLTEQEKSAMLLMINKLHKYHSPLFEANDELLLNDRLGLKTSVDS